MLSPFIETGAAVGVGTASDVDAFGAMALDTFDALPLAVFVLRTFDSVLVAVAVVAVLVVVVVAVASSTAPNSSLLRFSALGRYLELAFRTI